MILSGKLYQHVLLQPFNLHAFLNERNSKGPTFEKKLVNVCVCVWRYVLFHICVGINFVDFTWKRVSMYAIARNSFKIYIWFMTELDHPEVTLWGFTVDWMLKSITD